MSLNMPVSIDSSSSESDSDSSESISESDSSESSDSECLENWMILGRGEQVEDQSISLNLEGGSNSDTGVSLGTCVCVSVCLCVCVSVCLCVCVWPGEKKQWVILRGPAHSELLSYVQLIDKCGLRAELRWEPSACVHVCMYIRSICVCMFTNL